MCVYAPPRRRFSILYFHIYINAEGLKRLSYTLVFPLLFHFELLSLYAHTQTAFSVTKTRTLFFCLTEKTQAGKEKNSQVTNFSELKGYPWTSSAEEARAGQLLRQAKWLCLAARSLLLPLSLIKRVNNLSLTELGLRREWGGSQ